MGELKTKCIWTGIKTTPAGQSKEWWVTWTLDIDIWIVGWNMKMNLPSLGETGGKDNFVESIAELTRYPEEYPKGLTDYTLMIVKSEHHIAEFGNPTSGYGNIFHDAGQRVQTLPAGEYIEMKKGDRLHLKMWVNNQTTFDKVTDASAIIFYRDTAPAGALPASLIPLALVGAVVAIIAVILYAARRR